MNMIEKIAALRAKIPANGATEHEALAALQLADKLMQKHNITEADLNKVEFSRDMREGEFTQKQKTVHPSQKYCGNTIGTFCGVKLWTQRLTRTKQNVHMFGMIGDVAMAEFLMSLIHNSMDRGWKEFLATNSKKEGVTRHTEYWSFMIGFANTINEKLNDLIKQRETHVSSDGTDLIIIKMSLVEDGMESMLPSVKLKRSTRRGTILSQGAYGQGQAAGDKVNLSRPIRKQAGVKRITS
jgi:hypothetical protein